MQECHMREFTKQKQDFASFSANFYTHITVASY